MTTFMSSDDTGNISMIEVTTKYGKYRIQEKEGGELDIIKIAPFGDGLSIKPIVSNRIMIK